MKPNCPDYYLIPGCNMTLPQIIRALDLDFDQGCIIKYAVRCGRKPGVKASVDAGKARDCVLGWAAKKERDDA